MTQAASSVLDSYRALHPKSEALYARARNVIPGGVTHDGRHLSPFPIYVERAQGSHKWDVDGHEYIDYWMGHGALFLGHCHPAVVKAIQEQAARGTHFGASHELEVRWAELIAKLIPSAQMVRFAMSGTEATHLALRIARAFTGRPKILKFQGHFHGWHDGVVAAVNFARENNLRLLSTVPRSSWGNYGQHQERERGRRRGSRVRDAGHPPGDRELVERAQKGDGAAFAMLVERHQRQLYRQAGVNYHGMRVSADGRTLYVANIGNGFDTGARFANGESSTG